MFLRNRASLFALLLYLNCSSGLWAQAFQDLDFESASLVPIPSDTLSRVYLSAALPGWSGFAGTNQLTAVMYDSFALGSANISIFDTNDPAGTIEGNYTVLLQAGGNPFGVGAADVSLSQTGLVPSSTKSLSFLAFLAFPSSPFSVSLGGTNLNLIASAVANQNYNLYQADISTFAGQTLALTFTALAQNPPGQDCWLSLDSIQFSPTPIPEPSALSLLAIGVAGLVLLHRTHRKTE